MELGEFLLIAASVVAGLSATAAFGLAAMSSVNWAAVRGMFWASALSAGSIGAIWAGMISASPTPARVAVAAAIGAIVAISLTYALAWARGQEDKLRPPPTSAELKVAQMNDSKSGPTFNIQNSPGSIVNPSGGQNTITNNFGPQPRNLDSPWGAPLKAQILKELPRDKTITVMAIMGDVEGIQLANQIHAFLKANNFKLAEENGISQGVFTGPVKGLGVRDDGGGKLTFIVGANLP